MVGGRQSQETTDIINFLKNFAKMDFGVTNLGTVCLSLNVVEGRSMFGLILF